MNDFNSFQKTKPNVHFPTTYEKHRIHISHPIRTAAKSQIKCGKDCKRFFEFPSDQHFFCPYICVWKFIGWMSESLINAGLSGCVHSVHCSCALQVCICFVREFTVHSNCRIEIELSVCARSLLLLLLLVAYSQSRYAHVCMCMSLSLYACVAACVWLCCSLVYRNQFFV